MKAKFLLTVTLSASLLFIGLPFSTVSAASAGQKCSKVGLRSGTKKAPLVCAKTGKKLVWELSVNIATTTNTTINPKAKAPSAPTQLKLKMDRPFNGTGRFTWKDNSNNEKNFYVSQIDPVNLVGVSLKSLQKIPKDGTMLGLGSYLNENFCFWVMASNASGNSPWSGPACYLGGAATTTTTALVPPTTALVPPTTALVPPTTAYVPSYGGGGSSSANWLGCYFKGQRMWGSVYIAPYSFGADFIVYQSSYSFGADLKVYNTPYSFAASSCGIWYITPYSFAADFTIYLTPYSFGADFSIYTTSYSFGAGR
jgi:hypothetical protein